MTLQFREMHPTSFILFDVTPNVNVVEANIHACLCWGNGLPSIHFIKRSYAAKGLAKSVYRRIT